MKAKNLLLVLMILVVQKINAQQTIDTINPINKKRLAYVAVGGSVLYVSSMSALWQIWFATSPSSSFHFVNDNHHWLQVDKMGHAYSAYTISRCLNQSFRWCDMSEKKAVVLSGAMGWLSTTTIDILDGFSSKWGASYGDILANTFGAGMFTAQALGFKRQIVKFKWSYYERPIAGHSPELIWNDWKTRWFHNYNGHTYWFSINTSPIQKKVKWLSIAFGYSGNNMFSEVENPESIDGNSLIGIRRYRQFYLSLDIDPAQIKTRSKLLKTLLIPFEFIKVPFPALEYNGVDKLKLHGIFF